MNQFGLLACKGNPARMSAGLKPWHPATRTCHVMVSELSAAVCGMAWGLHSYTCFIYMSAWRSDVSVFLRAGPLNCHPRRAFFSGDISRPNDLGGVSGAH